MKLLVLNPIIKDINTIFLRKGKYNIPFVTLALLILNITLKIIQKFSNNPFYLQNATLNSSNELFAKEILRTNSQYATLNPFRSLFLIYLDIIGINGYQNSVNNSTTTGILVDFITYSLLLLIEMRVGHFAIVLILVLAAMYQYSIEIFRNLTCYNSIYIQNNLEKSAWCCGSFIMCFVLGIFLTIIFFNSHLTTQIIVAIVGFCIWAILIITDAMITFKKKNDKNQQNNQQTNQQICNAFLYHALIFCFGVFIGLSFTLRPLSFN